MANVSDKPLTVVGCRQLEDPTPTVTQSAASRESSAASFCSHRVESTHRTPASLHLTPDTINANDNVLDISTHHACLRL